MADQPLSGVASSMWQTNNTVDALAVANGVLYAGGRFTSVRPPGSAQGSNETARSYLAAFNASTGALITSFNVSLNDRVRALAVSADGSRLYIGGSFTTVNGSARSRLAAISLPSGSLDSGFTANASSSVTALAVSGSTLYVGGDFNTISGQSRSRIASVNRSTGALNAAFTASADNRVRTIAVPSDASRVLIGGPFDNVNGVPQAAIASLDPTSGALRPWAATGIVPRPANGGCSSATASIRTQGTTAYVTAEGDEPGCWEGVYAANISNGSLLWNANCLGAGQDITMIGGWLYKASHQHDCGRQAGGYVGEKNPSAFVWNRLTALRPSDGALAHFSPNTNGAGDEKVGPHVLATDGTRLFVGGDFTTVNGTAQRGLARFAPKGSNATPDQPPAPIATATAAGTVEITVRGTSDRDNGMLTYQLFRDSGTTPIATRAAESWPWSIPTLRFLDTGAAPGTTHTYAVRATDGSATSSRSANSGSVTVPTVSPSAYASVVTSTNPSLYWRLNDSGSTAADSSGNGATGTFVGGVTRGVNGAVAGDGAVRLDGASGFVRSSAARTATNSFSQSVWFRSTTRVGGDLLGFSDAATGPGTNNDRVLFLENDGKVVFAMRNNATNQTRFSYVRSLNTLADGAWHQATATYDGATMSLYVDGALQATAALSTPVAPGSGYLRAGYTSLTNFYTVFGRNFSNDPAPISNYASTSIDEVVLHASALSAAQVRAQYAAGRATPG